MATETRTTETREALDAWVREIIEWHFNPDTGCPYWLDWAKQAGWDPRQEVTSFKRIGIRIEFVHNPNNGTIMQL